MITAYSSPAVPAQRSCTTRPSSRAAASTTVGNTAGPGAPRVELFWLGGLVITGAGLRPWRGSAPAATRAPPPPTPTPPPTPPAPRPPTPAGRPRAPPPAPVRPPA